MTEKELKRLSRADLLEMLIAQSVELREMQEKLQRLEAQITSRQIAIDKAGSIAEAALHLNGVFEAAQASCEQYIENIRLLSVRQDEICAKREAESRQKAAVMLQETEKYCAEMKKETEEYCAKLKKENEQQCESIRQLMLEGDAMTAPEPQHVPDTAERPKKQRWCWRWRRQRCEKTQERS